jgi:hypothetical protein
VDRWTRNCPPTRQAQARAVGIIGDGWPYGPSVDRPARRDDLVALLTTWPAGAHVPAGQPSRFPARGTYMHNNETAPRKVWRALDLGMTRPGIGGAP